MASEQTYVRARDLRAGDYVVGHGEVMTVIPCGKYVDLRVRPHGCVNVVAKRCDEEAWVEIAT